MKDDMYTYHYFKNRSIVGMDRVPDYWVQATVFCGIVYAAVTLINLFR
ncbi:MAG: hypothetical protein P4N41_08865 [Negativicutes bacterium]|nr:hypothetical protein [Negativicutes bacterium]